MIWVYAASVGFCVFTLGVVCGSRLTGADFWYEEIMDVLEGDEASRGMISKDGPGVSPAANVRTRMTATQWAEWLKWYFHGNEKG